MRWLNRFRTGSTSPDPDRAPDLDPSEVEPGTRVGFDGRPLKGSRGGITGLEGGVSTTGGLPLGELQLRPGTHSPVGDSSSASAARRSARDT